MASGKERVLNFPQVRERSILRNVYLWMMAGLALTGVVSLFMASRPQLVLALVRTPALFFWGVLCQVFVVGFI